MADCSIGSWARAISHCTCQRVQNPSFTVKPDTLSPERLFLLPATPRPPSRHSKPWTAVKNDRNRLSPDHSIRTQPPHKPLPRPRPVHPRRVGQWQFPCLFHSQPSPRHCHRPHIPAPSDPAKGAASFALGCQFQRHPRVGGGVMKRFRSCHRRVLTKRKPHGTAFLHQ